MTGPVPWRHDDRLARLLGALLLRGVLAAAAIVAVGGLLYVSTRTGETVDYRTFHAPPPEFSSVRGVLAMASALDGRAIIEIGLLVLLATPFARVAVSMLLFLFERDWMYAAITGIVLALLAYSLLAG